jgi:hypothetical protein
MKEISLKDIQIAQLKILALLTGKMQSASWWENNQKVNIHVTPEGDVDEHGGITCICEMNWVLGSLRDK